MSIRSLGLGAGCARVRVEPRRRPERVFNYDILAVEVAHGAFAA